MPTPPCAVCRADLRATLEPWCFRCPSCGTWASSLTVAINSSAHRSLDEERREVGLAELRRYNFGVITDRLLEEGLQPGSRLLDVGSAHGWFLEAAASCGLKVEGIEPDEAVAAGTVFDNVRVGFFPDVLDQDEQFDAITYNDVLEHLPDVNGAVEASAAHLTPGGLLSVNIPNSRGLFYRIAVLCHRIGLRAAFRRLWQVGLPSPHLWYFDAPGLTRLCESHGLELVSAQPLDSVRRPGLWQRAHADRSPSPTSVLGFVGVWLLAPLFNGARTSDIMHLIFRKAESS